MSVDVNGIAEPAADERSHERVAAPVSSSVDWRAVASHLPIVVLLAGVALLCHVFYESGHDWGDDFALYIHQAQALVNGNVGETIANNRYAIDNSGWSSFSPLVYPWGFPILISPVVALWGVDYAKLKIVVVLTFLGYLFCLHRLVQRRAGPVPAALLVALIGGSTLYLGWTSSVVSDYPFLCAVGVALVWMDRCRIRGLFEADNRRDLVILGLLMAFAFSTRREGLALVVALAAVHLVTLGPRWLRGDDDDTVPPIRWSRVAVPYWTFVGSAIALQFALPGVLYPRFEGTGTQQIKPNVIWFRDILAEHIGLKDIGVPRILLFGSWRLAAIVLGAFVGLAALGLLARLVAAPAEDIMLIAYLLAHGYIVLTAPFHEGRYMLGITPLLGYFAYQALPTITAAFRRGRVGLLLHRVAVVASATALAGLVVANATDTRIYANYHLRDKAVINGPTAPAALEMEEMVRQCTRGDDVVVFFRARAMSLLTERKSIQTGNIDQVMARGDWYVMNVGSTYSQPLVEDADAARLGLRKVWANAEWVLWLIPGGAADGRTPAC